jgi:hypothetical protein
MTMMKKALCSALCVLLLITAARADDADDAVKAEARKAADAWLILVDSGKYVDSWSQAARLFRQAVTRDQWAETVRAVREPLGAVKGRSLESATRTHSVPNVPDGDYVVFRFKTTFENNESAVETITPARDVDGAWRVSSYFVQ